MVGVSIRGVPGLFEFNNNEEDTPPSIPEDIGDQADALKPSFREYAAVSLATAEEWTQDYFQNLFEFRHVGAVLIYRASFSRLVGEEEPTRTALVHEVRLVENPKAVHRIRGFVSLGGSPIRTELPIGVISNEEPVNRFEIGDVHVELRDKYVYARGHTYQLVEVPNTSRVAVKELPNMRHTLVLRTRGKEDELHPLPFSPAARWGRARQEPHLARAEPPLDF